jgi:ATP-dependent DNA helicase PIF1
MQLSTEQQYALQQFSEGKNLFVTGPGGTGKTKLIHHLVENAKTAGKAYQVCAMTGCAAILLNCNARTIHSWSGIKTARGAVEMVVAGVLRNKRTVAVWRKIKILIIDEVSMMSEKIFNILNEIGKKSRRSSSPFGGIQVVFTGDFYQLPPVPTVGEPSTEKFCFESVDWPIVFPLKNHIQLVTMFRQTDPLYIEILQQIRIGELTEENKKILQGYVKREYDPVKHNDCILTKLFPIRSKADYVNQAQFSKIEEEEYTFECIKKTDCSTYIENNIPLSLEAMMKCRALEQKDIEFELETLLSNTGCNESISLKKGCAVMCTVNIDMESGICNGSQGTIIGLTMSGLSSGLGEALPIVKFSNGQVRTIQRHYWQSEEYPTIAIGQIPLTLAWALTIHKIQGATMSMAEIDIGQAVFEYGQTYVALSRIQSLEGLYLSAFHAHRIRANPKVTEFYKNIPKIDMNVRESLNTDKKIVLDFEKYTYLEKEDEKTEIVDPTIKKIRL